jgi:hypothetical protein
LSKIILLLLFSISSFAAKTEYDRAEDVIKNILAPYNPGFEAGKGGWTASAGSFGLETSGANFSDIGKDSASFDASATDQTLSSTSVTIPKYLYGANGLASCRFKTTATDYLFQVYDGSNVVATQTISATTTFTKQSLNFIFPSSGSVLIRVKSASNAAAIYFDDCYLGDASNLTNVSQAQFIGSAYFATTGSCTWSRTNTALGAFSTNSSCPGPTVEFNPSTSTIQTTDADLPKVTVNNLPPGEYLIMVTGSALPSAASINTFAINDGTTTSGRGLGPQSAGARAQFTIVGNFSYTTTANRTFEIYGAASSGNVVIENDGGTELMKFAIYRYPSTSEIAYRHDLINWRVDANISGANPSLGTSAQTSYTGITDSSLTLTNNTGNGVLTAQIPCSTTVASSGTTCSSGSESIGVAFDLPKAGDVLACASFSHVIQVTGGSARVDATFQIVETPNNAQTISQEGKSRVMSDLSTASAAIEVSHPVRVCGTFTFASAGQKTLRLFYEQAVTATVTTNVIAADAGANNGQRDIHWEVYPINQLMPAPILVGSVTSASTGALRIEGANVTSGGTVTEIGASDWLNGNCSLSTSTFTCTINSGIFSATPSCVVTLLQDPPSGGTDAQVLGIKTVSSTSLVYSMSQPGSGNTPKAAHVICMGAR